MDNKSDVRILVVDNDPRVRRDLEVILQTEGYSVALVEGFGLALLDQVWDKARLFRPHVAIVDLRLLDEGKESEDSGLSLLKRLSSSYFILYSAYLTPPIINRALEARVFAVVGKDESPERLLAAVTAAAQKGSARYRGFQVHWPSAWTPRQICETLFGKQLDIPPDIVEDTLGRLFPEATLIKLETLEGAADSPPASTDGRKHSVVLKVSWGERQPVAVKMDGTGRIREEEKRYRHYIEGFLTGQFHARLERHDVFWDMAGMVFSFLGSSASRPICSFNTLYEQKSSAKTILKPLYHLFGEVWSQLYQRSQPYELGTNLFNAYDQMLELERKLQTFPEQEETITFPGLAVPLINPISWVQRHISDSAIPGSRQAITHGDLHGDNFFVDGVHAWAIDFERTGPGPILRDFTELEVHITTHLATFLEAELALFGELVIILASPSKPTAWLRPTDRLSRNTEVTKALTVVKGLRNLARRVTHYQDFREYLWGLLLDSVFVATLVPEGSTQYVRALLLGVRVQDIAKSFSSKKAQDIAKSF